jgi:Trk K+ transport system NAD-binding subunit
VVGIAEDLGAGHFDMFDFSLPVLIAGSAGLLFLWLVAPRLLPERKPMLSDTSPRLFNAVLHINEDSFANGRTLAEALERTENQMRVDRIQRTESLSVVRLPSVTLQTGDRLYVRNTPERLKEFEQLLGATLFNTGDAANPVSDATPLDSGDQQLAEVVVSRGSPLHHRTLDAVRFSTRFRLAPLALHRARSSREMEGNLGAVRLRIGDVILVQGSAEAIQELKTSGSILVLDSTVDLPRTRCAPMALAIMGSVVALAATGTLSISVAALLGVAAMILTGCMNWRDVGDSLNLPLVMIIVASLCLGLAMLETGGAQFLGHVFVAGTQGLSTPLVLSGLILLITLLTNVVSNNAAAVIGTPVAISIANEIGAPIEPFVLAVIFGANMSFATPIGYQTNLLIMSAGGYRFSDFVRVGIPLTLIMWLAFSLLLPVLYELG